ncbi:hypothetical protein PaeCFBP13512_22305 [Paenibacillus sp. CFBP13512]|nr:hypothetical protein PaeCFBP13512_22305 [Paenibacillus sp. CFBP13512]
MDQLFSEIRYAHDKFFVYTYLYNRFVDFPQTQEISSSFFAISMDSLQNDAIIRTAKLFDKGHKSYGTLYKLLNLMEAHLDQFGIVKDEVKDKLASHKIYYQNQEVLINNLLIWRDKHFAHPDKKYFLDKNRINLAEHAPMLVGDLPKLLKTSVEILNFYSYKLFEITYFFKDFQIEHDVDKLFMVFNQHLENN